MRRAFALALALAPSVAAADEARATGWETRCAARFEQAAAALAKDPLRFPARARTSYSPGVFLVLEGGADGGVRFQATVVAESGPDAPWGQFRDQPSLGWYEWARGRRGLWGRISTLGATPKQAARFHSELRRAIDFCLDG